jgi:hypothetical protein
MSPRFDPDPLSLGLVATLTCVECQRDRYGECMSDGETDVLTGPGVCEIKGVPCTCGATLIRIGWLESSLYEE